MKYMVVVIKNVFLYKYGSWELYIRTTKNKYNMSLSFLSPTNDVLIVWLRLLAINKYNAGPPWPLSTKDYGVKRGLAAVIIGHQWRHRTTLVAGERVRCPPIVTNGG